MPELSTAPSDVVAWVWKIKEQFHPALIEHRVTTGLLMAYPSKPLLPALKLHGYQCAAISKITPYAQRVQGIEDTSVTFDMIAWNRFTDAEKDALVDHELHHFSPMLDKRGILRADASGRPKIRMRLHDWELGGFAVIAHRHGKASLDVKTFQAVAKEYHQQLFGWTSDTVAPPGSIFTPEVVAEMNAEFKSQFGEGTTLTVRRG